MKRRQFVFSAATLGLLSGCGVLPNPGKAASPRVVRLGILTLDANGPTTGPTFAGLRQGLAELGYVDGQTIAIELRDPGGSHPERLPELANELIQLPVDVLVAGPSPAVLAAQRATTGVPIVFEPAIDPVGKGFVASLDHPGGNITGVSNVPPTVFGKLIQYLAQLMPALSRVAFVSNFDPASTSGAGGAEGPSIVQLMTTAATALGVQLKLLNVRAPEDVEPALAEALAWQTGAIIVGGFPFTDPTPRFVDFQLRNRIPFASYAGAHAQAGDLFAYGPNLTALGRLSATLVDKICKGARPADLPVEQPTVYDLVINQTTAEALGVTIPPEFAQQVTQWVQ